MILVTTSLRYSTGVDEGSFGVTFECRLYESTSSQSPQGGLGWQNSFATQQFIELQGVRGPLGTLCKIGVFGPFYGKSEPSVGPNRARSRRLVPARSRDDPFPLE